MKGYDSKEAMAGHRYNMSEKHRRRESEGMKRYEDKKKGSKSEVFGHDNKHMYGVNTMSENYDMGRMDYRKQTTRGQPPEAWDYDY
jgi:hypothetical protein